jgi:hypothetical protein
MWAEYVLIGLFGFGVGCVAGARLIVWGLDGGIKKRLSPDERATFYALLKKIGMGDGS